MSASVLCPGSHQRDVGIPLPLINCSRSRKEMHEAHISSTKLEQTCGDCGLEISPGRRLVGRIPSKFELIKTNLALQSSSPISRILFRRGRATWQPYEIWQQRERKAYDHANMTVRSLALSSRITTLKWSQATTTFKGILAPFRLLLDILRPFQTF